MISKTTRGFCLLTLFVTVVVDGQEFTSAKLTGKVFDSAGKPLAGATVLCNRTTGARVDVDGSFRGLTDEQGRFELTLRFEQGKTLVVREVFAEMPGYARAAPPADLPLQAGATAEINFELAKGEVFAGVVRLPPNPLEQLSRRKPDQLQRVFEVIGPGTEALTTNARSYLTDGSGRFEIYLPAGEYTLRVHGYSIEPIEWSGLKTGKSDLVLELPPFEWSEESVGKLFDEFWEVMDRRYSYFFLKDVNWRKLKEEYRPKAVQAKDAKELAASLQAMLAALQDIHVWIETPEGKLPTHRSSYAVNANTDRVLAQLEERTDCGRFALVGETKPDGFGYFLMRQQSAADAESVKKAIETIRKLALAPGFIVDLRKANGGSEPLAMEIAQLFCATNSVYAKSKYRNGPGHDDFGPEGERILPGSADAFVKPVVCLIGPGAVSSGEGFVKMMKCLPNVITVGLPTRGASGNPRPWPLGRTGLTVYFSRWVDLMPDGQTFEGRGVPPEITVAEPPDAYKQADPTLARGLKILREKTRTAGAAAP
jgi:hypothetical protein